jgi:hypothetical protein
VAPREEHLLFDLSDSPVEYLLAQAVTIESLCNELHLRGILPIVHVVLPQGVLDDFIGLFGASTILERSGMLRWHLHEFDLAVHWDMEALYREYGATGKHVTQVLGLTVGGDPPTPFPQKERLMASGVVPLLDTDKDIDILLLEDTLPFSEVRKWLCAEVPELSIHMCSTWSRFELLCRARMVIGWRGFHTYLAAALGCAVVELYPEDEYRRTWLSKWSAPGGYQMVGGAAADILEHPARTIKGVQLLWE